MNSEEKLPVLSLASVLYGLSLFYGCMQKLRGACYRQNLFASRKLPCKVISIGNITVWVTGKTPMTIHLAKEVKQLGYTAAIVSRGYKGSAENQGGIVSNGKRLYMNPEMAGDEPYMIASRLKGVPVLVGKNRFKTGMLALREFQPDIIILDDAYQHLKLKRDIDLILLDQKRPFGNTHLLPRGILREPIASLVRGTACILTRCKYGVDAFETPSTRTVEALFPGRPVFTSFHVPYGYEVKRGDLTPFNAVSDFFSANEFGDINHRKIFGFSGIARNDDFQRTVKDLGFDVTGFLEFSDHHRYSAEDLKKIWRTAEETGAQRLITTEKDHVRFCAKGTFPMDMVVVGIKVSFGDGRQDFIAFLKDRLQP